MQQTTSPSTLSANYVARSLCYYPAAVAVALVVKTGRALRLLPRRMDYFVGMEARSAWGCYREDHAGCRTLGAALGWVRVVIDWPLAG